MAYRLSAAIATTVLAFSATAHEATSISASDIAWNETYFQAGGTLNTGNTETSQALLKSDIIYSREHIKNKLYATAEYGTKMHSKNKEIYNFGEELNYYFAARKYFYFNIDGLINTFSPYRYTFTETIGLGYFIIDQPKWQLKLQTGPGLRQARTREDDKFILNGIFGTSINLHLHVNDVTTFNQKVAVHVPFSGPEQFKTYKSKTSIHIKMSDRLHFVASANVIHYSDIPPDAKNDSRTDTSSSFSLRYKI